MRACVIKRVRPILYGTPCTIPSTEGFMDFPKVKHAKLIKMFLSFGK